MATEIYTTAYPRSGTTWLNRLLSDILRSPMQAWNDDAVIADFCGECGGDYLVRKTHIAAHELELYARIRPLGKIVFIQRDPRDVAISAMYYRSLQPSDENLMGTIRTMIDRKAPTQKRYRIYHRVGIYEAFVRGWVDGPGEADVVTKYETLHETPFPELRRIIYTLTGETFDDGHIAASYARQSFDVLASQYPHSMRKGIVGDWKNHFKRHHGQYITKKIGGLMIDSGYIDSLDWWRQLPI